MVLQAFLELPLLKDLCSVKKLTKSFFGIPETVTMWLAHVVFVSRLQYDGDFNNWVPKIACRNVSAVTFQALKNTVIGK